MKIDRRIAGALLQMHQDNIESNGTCAFCLYMIQTRFYRYYLEYDDGNYLFYRIHKFDTPFTREFLEVE